VSDEAAKIRTFEEAAPYGYPYVRELCIEPAFQEGGYVCDLRLRLSNSEPGRTPDRSEEVLDLRFVGVRDLRLEQTTVPFAVRALQIRDVSDRQMEDVGYLVMDLEEEVLRFFCRDFEWTATREE
jgi:hypothetical protein